MTTQEKLAGHELRGAVADKVFGRYGVTVGLRRVMYFSDPSPDGTRLFHDAPKYEVDMAAAWLVVEHFRDAKFSVKCRFSDALEKAFPEQQTNGMYVVPWPWAIMQVTPADICRAALVAVE